MGNLGKALSTVLVALFLSTLATTPFAASGNTKTVWDVQSLNDQDAWAGGHCPIAVDSNNITHIAYMAFPDGTNSLIYTSYNGSGWINQTVDGSGYVFVVFSLLFDPNGNPHILYNTSPLGSPIDPLKIASWNGRSWDLQSTGINYAIDAALAVDSLGKFHILYTTGIYLKYGATWEGSALKYASSTGLDWDIQTIDSKMTDGFSSISFQLSPALASKNAPSVLYSSSSNSSDIKLATFQNSNWKIQPVQLSSSIGKFGNVVVDSKGYPHFLYTQSYQNSTTFSTIFYASFNGTAWNTQTVTSKINLGWDNPIGKLVLDSQDYPYFTYSTTDNGSMYASYSGSDWNIQSCPGGPCDLALDASGNPHLSYRTYSPMRYTSDLVYAAANLTSLSPTPLPAQASPTLVVVLGVVVMVVVIAGVLVYLKKRSVEG